MIWLEGGGLCVEPIDCWQRTKENLGSSTHWPTTKEDSNNVLSTDASNPFANWTHVFVPYCTGGTYMGRQRGKNFMGLTFAGHLGLDAIVSDLLNTTGLASAERVLFSGQSAGGIGVFHNADWLGERLRAAGSTGWYAAFPQAGAFMAADDLVMMPEYATLNMSLSFTQFASAYLVEFVGGTNTNPDERPLLDASCVAAHARHAHACWSDATAYPYVETPLFVAQNTIDKVQAGDVFGADWWPLPLKDHGAAKAEYLDALARGRAPSRSASVLNNSAKAVADARARAINTPQREPGWFATFSYAAALRALRRHAAPRRRAVQRELRAAAIRGAARAKIRGTSDVGVGCEARQRCLRSATSDLPLRRRALGSLPRAPPIGDARGARRPIALCGTDGDHAAVGQALRSSRETNPSRGHLPPRFQGTAACGATSRHYTSGARGLSISASRGVCLTHPAPRKRGPRRGNAVARVPRSSRRTRPNRRRPAAQLVRG